MAFNDAVFSAQDWEALKSIHDSSKSTDESLVKSCFFFLIPMFTNFRKIGKYGVGFRSVFNVITILPCVIVQLFLPISSANRFPANPFRSSFGHLGPSMPSSGIRGKDNQPWTPVKLLSEPSVAV